jgi:hypothetical protein
VTHSFHVIAGDVEGIHQRITIADPYHHPFFLQNTRVLEFRSKFNSVPNTASKLACASPGGTIEWNILRKHNIRTVGENHSKATKPAREVQRWHKPCHSILQTVWVLQCHDFHEPCNKHGWDIRKRTIGCSLVPSIVSVFDALLASCKERTITSILSWWSSYQRDIITSTKLSMSMLSLQAAATDRSVANQWLLLDFGNNFNATDDILAGNIQEMPTNQ